MSNHIGQRVAARIDEVFPDRTRKDLAAEIGMAPDAFSRALGGHRAFSSIELVRLAGILSADLHWIITGEPDPHALVIAARHQFDHKSGQRDLPGEITDRQLLEDIGLAYRQAYQGVELASSALPSTPEEVRRVLGPDFVRPFINLLESRLDIDVVRIAGLSTSYCLSIAGRRVIVVAAHGNWFHENWSIAHELGHLAGGHLVAERSRAIIDSDEASANAFAAELLMPANSINALDWKTALPSEVAERVWDLGISTNALARRLSALKVDVSSDVMRLLDLPTQRLLRWHWDRNTPDVDQITQRMNTAASRRFPISLQEAHVKLIGLGRLGKGTLAWMLDTPPDSLEVDAPPNPSGPSTDELGAALGLWA